MVSGLVLDGGLATELQSMGYDVERDDLFGASLLATDPSTIRTAHKRFLENGANIVTTATYQATVEALMTNLDVVVDAAHGLIADSVALARQACQSFSGRKFPPIVAGSVGPYGACLRDGSEYTGSYLSTINEEQLMTWHRPRMSRLLQSGVDVIAAETIPAAEEALALVRLLREFPSARAWLSFSCKDSRHVCGGQSLTDAVHRCLRADAGRQIVAIGVNCTDPRFVTELLESCGDTGGVPFIVYPNAGQQWQAVEKSKWVADANCPRLQHLAGEWMELGAGIVGGCCGIASADIAPLAAQMSSLPKSFA